MNSQNKYSKSLIDETILCFKKENDVLLTEEEAVAALDGFAGLYLAFAGIRG